MHNFCILLTPDVTKDIKSSLYSFPGTWRTWWTHPRGRPGPRLRWRWGRLRPLCQIPPDRRCCEWPRRFWQRPPPMPAAWRRLRRPSSFCLSQRRRRINSSSPPVLLAERSQRILSGTLATDRENHCMDISDSFWSFLELRNQRWLALPIICKFTWRRGESLYWTCVIQTCVIQLPLPVVLAILLNTHLIFISYGPCINYCMCLQTR